MTIAASLENGDQLVGQCNISHPIVPSTPRGTSLGGTGLDHTCTWGEFVRFGRADTDWSLGRIFRDDLVWPISKLIYGVTADI